MLWLSCDGQRNVLELFSDNSYLSAILDRQGLLVTAQKQTLEPRRLGNLSSQQMHVFWSKLKKKSPKIVVMSPTVTNKNSEHKEVFMALVSSTRVLVCVTVMFQNPADGACDDRAHGTVGPARRRRNRQLRAFLKHERMTVAMNLATH